MATFTCKKSDPTRRVMVTAATYQKKALFNSDARLQLLQDRIFAHCHDLDWKLEAWAVFANHYHLITVAPQSADIQRLIKRIHGSSARELNDIDGTKGRQVWYRYWDTQLTYEKSYLARLAYVHQNPVKHGVVKMAEHYRFCSMSWFMSESDPAFRHTVLSFKTDKVNVHDDF